MNRIEDLIAALQKREEEKNKNTVLWILAIVGAVAVVAGIATAAVVVDARDNKRGYDKYPAAIIITEHPMTSLCIFRRLTFCRSQFHLMPQRATVSLSLFLLS